MVITLLESIICFGSGQDGHFRGDKKCAARDQACRRCGGIGHFMVTCPQLQTLHQKTDLKK